MGKEIDPIITDDSWGYLLTAYYPVYDSNGTCTCYAGTDVDLELINRKIRSYLTEIISVYIGFFIVFGTLINWLTEYLVSLPLKTITKRVYDFIASDNLRILLIFSD